MWTCPKCGERLEDQFDSCWKCAGQAEATATPSKGSSRWKRAILVGIVFEIALVFLSVTLPRDSWLFAKAISLLTWSHYPLLKLLAATEVESSVLAVLLLLLVASVMALFWAVITYGIFALRTALGGRFGLPKRVSPGIKWCLALVVVIAVGSAFVGGGRGTPRTFQPSPEVKSVVESNTRFALVLYRTLKKQPGNVFVSPYSIATALGMVLAGAKGQTEQEIAAALHLSLTQTNFHHAAGVMSKRLSELQRRGRIRLTVANSIWCQEGDPFTEDFLEVMRESYQATAEMVNFENDMESTSRKINKWIQRNTGNEFKDVIQPGQFAGDTSLVLCNAIYFKGRWASRFKRGETKPAPFYVAREQSVSVPMMHQKSEFKMARVVEEDLTLRLLELPYYGQDLSMVVLLPEAVDGLGELERRLESNELRAWLKELDQQPDNETLVWFPRFKTSKRHNLIPVLNALGVAKAFDREAADFSGIDRINNLYLSTALHQAFVEVDEEGTKAAAVTAFEAKSRGGPRDFRADHPFVFLIRENSTGIILFLGRVADPTQ